MHFGKIQVRKMQSEKIQNISLGSAVQYFLWLFLVNTTLLICYLVLRWIQIHIIIHIVLIGFIADPVHVALSCLDHEELLQLQWFGVTTVTIYGWRMIEKVATAKTIKTSKRLCAGISEGKTGKTTFFGPNAHKGRRVEKLFKLPLPKPERDLESRFLWKIIGRWKITDCAAVTAALIT